MKYVYVFDYSFNHIYEIILNEAEAEEFNKNNVHYLYHHYNIKQKNCAWLISNKKLKIESVSYLK